MGKIHLPKVGNFQLPLTLYSYGFNSPLNYVDPSGMFSVGITGLSNGNMLQFAGAVLGAIGALNPEISEACSLLNSFISIANGVNKAKEAKIAAQLAAKEASQSVRGMTTTQQGGYSQANTGTNSANDATLGVKVEILPGGYTRVETKDEQKNYSYNGEVQGSTNSVSTNNDKIKGGIIIKDQKSQENFLNEIHNSACGLYSFDENGYLYQLSKGSDSRGRSRALDEILVEAINQPFPIYLRYSIENRSNIITDDLTFEVKHATIYLTGRGISALDFDNNPFNIRGKARILGINNNHIDTSAADVIAHELGHVICQHKYREGGILNSINPISLWLSESYAISYENRVRLDLGEEVRVLDKEYLDWLDIMWS